MKITPNQQNKKRFDIDISVPLPSDKGIKGYSKLVGIVLCVFGFAIKLKDDAGKKFYLNRKSAIHWIERVAPKEKITKNARKADVISKIETIVSKKLSEKNNLNNDLSSDNKSKELERIQKEKEERLKAEEEEKLKRIELEKRLKPIINEFIETELSFQKHFTVLCANLIILDTAIKLRGDNKKKETLISFQEEINELNKLIISSTNLVRVKDGQKFGELFEALNSFNSDKLHELLKSDTFKNHINNLFYFISNQEKIEGKLDKIIKSIPDFYKKFEENISQNKDSKGLTSQSLLVTPMQRAERYALLSDALAKVDEKYRDSSTIIKKYVEGLNEKKRALISEMKLQAFNNYLDGIGTTDRFNQKKGLLNKVPFNKKKPPISKNAAPVFVDLLRRAHVDDIKFLTAQILNLSKGKTTLDDSKKLNQHLKTAALIQTATKSCLNDEEKKKPDNKELVEIIEKLETAVKKLQSQII